MENYELDNATASYIKSIEINDGDWEAHRGLGVAYMMKVIDQSSEDEQLKADLRAKAVRHWRQSLKLKPDQPHRERLLKFIETYSK